MTKSRPFYRQMIWLLRWSPRPLRWAMFLLRECSLETVGGEDRLNRKARAVKERQVQVIGRSLANVPARKIQTHLIATECAGLAHLVGETEPVSESAEDRDLVYAEISNPLYH